MMDALDLYHWDSCLFYEYLKGENVGVDKKVAIENILVENKEKRNRICTSVITHAEILPKKLGPDSEVKYWSMFGSMHFFDIDISRQILELAREIKDYYYIPPDEADKSVGKMMSTGDAFQLATAIAHDVTEFHTRDGKRKGGNVSLLGLGGSDGKVCGVYPLKIVSPSTSQGNLDV